MEENVQPNEQQLIVTEEMRSYIYDIAKWANFLAIVGFVISGFIGLASFTVGTAMNSDPGLSKLMSTYGLSASSFAIICLLYAFAIFYPSLLLFKYAVKAKFGVLYGEQASLDEALGKMKSLFKYWGIITVGFLCLYILSVLLTIIGAVAKV